MTDDEKTKLKEIEETAIFYRGTILHECIILEKTIDDFIAKDISLDEEVGVRVFQILLERMTFDSKITAMSAIMDDAQRIAGFIKTKKGRYPHADLIKNIKTIKDERNYFAHQPAWIRPDVLDHYPSVAFVNFRDTAKIEFYDQTRVSKLIELIHGVVKEIEELIYQMETYKSNKLF